MGRSLAGAFALAALLAGCATTSAPGVPASPLCYRAYPRMTSTCIRDLPAPELDAAAKRFEPDTRRTTVYVLRDGSPVGGDLRVKIDAAGEVPSYPHTFAIVHLAAGVHTFTLKHPSGEPDDQLRFRTRAGEFVFVMISEAGRVSLLDPSRRYRLTRLDDAEGRRAVQPLRVIAVL